MTVPRLRYLAYQTALALPSALCAVAAAQSVPPGRPYFRLASVAVVVVLWLLASARLRRWYFDDRLKDRLRSGHYDEVIATLTPVFAMATTAETRARFALLLSTCELERGNQDQALKWLAAIPEEKLTGLAHSMYLTQKARAIPRPEEALPVAEEALQASRGGPNEVAALTARGIVLLRAGRPKEAIRDLEEAMRQAEEAGGQAAAFAASRLHALAEAYLAAGDNAQALPTLRRVASYAPHIPVVRQARAKLAALASEEATGRASAGATLTGAPVNASCPGNNTPTLTDTPP